MATAKSHHRRLGANVAANPVCYTRIGTVITIFSLFTESQCADDCSDANAAAQNRVYERIEHQRKQRVDEYVLYVHLFLRKNSSAVHRRRQQRQANLPATSAMRLEVKQVDNKLVALLRCPTIDNKLRIAIQTVRA